MKKFLIFLVAIITTVCIGVTFYQFAKNDEVITVNTQTIYINYGDKLTLDDIGFSRKEASKETKIDFNAGGDEVTSIIKFDELSGSYIPTSKGGSTTIKITTTNRKYKSFTIDVMVGIGTEEFPYYISNETQLFDVTNAHIDDNACFKVVNDINLSQVHTPIGLIDGDYREFTGKFNGGYHTISNLNIESCDYAGLFAIMGANSEVYNLNVDNAIIEGEFINVGTIAGKCFGTINKVIVSNSTITNNKTDSNTGAIVGVLETDNLNSVTASILRTSAHTDQNTLITANGNLGGLAGSVNCAIVHACYSNLNLKNNSNSVTGGLVGNMIVNQNTYIRESYAINKIQSNGTSGNIVGFIDLDNNTPISNVTKELVLVGLYYEKSLNKFSGVGSDVYGFSTSTSFAINGKSNAEMKDKDTYIYYVNSTSNIVYWDKVWYLVDGEYPTLTFATKFDEVILEGVVDSLPTNPDISNPDNPNATAIIISNKEQLIDALQNKDMVNGNYILNANIDLEGFNWIPVKFSGTFKSSENQNYTISNFTILGDNLLYAGFFYNLASATVSNVTFSNVTLTSSTANETVGVVVGHIRGNVVIKNVDVVNAQISTTTKYAGGIAGYISNVITKIEKCSTQNLNITNALNVGGIVGYTSEESYIISCKVKDHNSINGVDRIGGIAAVNHGTIYECLFSGNISTINSSTAGYFGGLVGVNYSNILNSATFAEIKVNNPSSSDSEIYYFVGGLAGYNLGIIDNCSSYADEINTKQSTGIVYVAGLTGYNAGTLQYCVADISSIGSVDKNIYTAGLSVFNYGGNIIGCFVFGNLNGYQVAGLVRTNTNYGIIDSSMAGTNEIVVTNSNGNNSNSYISTITQSLEGQNSIEANKSFKRAIYKGVQVATFVYEISSGTISNCIVNADLNCTNDNGWIAGFAGFMPYNEDKFGTISYSISNVSFNGVGTKYLEIAQEGLMKKKRTTGTITNCIISEDANIDGVVVAKYSKILWITQTPGSDSNYIIATNDQLADIGTYLDPNTCNFDISTGLTNSKWLYINNLKLPIPRAYLDVFGYDIIDLS
ncbi:MAG: hypothetical protein IJ458_02315 [Clostridia bacterium]|nr:hypothetical protein [Clostridia bacterium]